MRLMECVRLRVKDVDFGRGEILIRDGKGAKDRVTMLPQSVVAPLQTSGTRAERGLVSHCSVNSGSTGQIFRYRIPRKHATNGRRQGKIVAANRIPGAEHGPHLRAFPGR
jgi:integrase